MRIERVKPGTLPVMVTCCKCGRGVKCGEGEAPVWADLDAMSFEAYYCDPCAHARKIGEPH